MIKSLASISILCVSCFGCVSYPIIDEAIADLEANPLPIAERFNLPDTPPLAIEPQPAELLLGKWESGVLHPVCRSVIVSGEIYDHPESYRTVIQSYVFNSDGTCGRVDALQKATEIVVSTKLGTWSYDSGALTLHYTKESEHFKDYYWKLKGYPDCERDVTRELDLTVTCRVEWFTHGEISITEIEDKPMAQSDPRKTVTEVVDAYGVKIRREILVFGVIEGRKVGNVDETVYPPMHLKKAQ